LIPESVSIMSTDLHRPAAVAGMFYPGSASVLSNEVAAMLAGVDVAEGAPAKALIVPHAGYVYSGPIAASAYACLVPLRKKIRRVVLLGPTHRVAVRGLAVSSASAFDTPLGSVPVDMALRDAVLKLPQVRCNDDAHALEHSLEVQLPFLQSVLDAFTLLPLAVGQAGDAEVAEVLECVWGDAATLIVVSSDLSHYHPYAEAQQLDGATARQILALHELANHAQACGATPINGLLLCARRHGLHVHLLDLRNSGDTAGDRSRVVGYAAFAFSEAIPHE
jgi:AmmeMemoRadiSam system protein B